MILGLTKEYFNVV
ncbi:hypothetical protein R3I94_020063 [Phoxinus phoxinus]